MMKQVKQVIVVRRDLNMTTGKSISPGCHASLSFLTKPFHVFGFGGVWVYYNLIRTLLSKPVRSWIENGFTKICLAADTEDQIYLIAAHAKHLGIECNVIKDSGKTEFKGKPTVTCLALGPDYSDRIDVITGNLKLL